MLNKCVTHGLLVIALGAGAGCHKTLSTRVSQPNPLCQPLETLRDSEAAVIVTGDHELRTPYAAAFNGSPIGSNLVALRNVATFSVVSRDRLRFRVQLEHKWQEWADASTWKIFLQDDRGNRFEPEDVEVLSNIDRAQMWDQNSHRVTRSRFGDVTSIDKTQVAHPQPLASISIFRGVASISFYQRDLFDVNVRSLRLVMRRRTRSLHFNWQFQNDAGLDTDVNRVAGVPECSRRLAAR